MESVTLVALIQAEYPKLLDSLAATTEELSAVLGELAFTRSQELAQQALAWNGTPDDSIQKKDRAAKYSAINLTREVWRIEGQRDALIERKFFIIRLLDDHRHGLR